MWKQVLTGVLLIAAGAQASTLEELRQLEAHKTTPGKASQMQTAATSSSPVSTPRFLTVICHFHAR